MLSISTVTSTALQAGPARLAARTPARAAVSAQIQFGPPPEGFEWGYSTLDGMWEDAVMPAPAAPAPAAPAPAPAASSVSSWYDAGVRLSGDETPAAGTSGKNAPTILKEGFDNLMAGLKKDDVMDVPTACKFMADPSLDSVSVADKKAFLASKGVDAFVIAQAECVAPEDNVQGHPELPVSEGVMMSVPDACKFMADPSLDTVSVADKKAFLASKGVDEFVIAQAECVAPEDNVQGHPELPVPESTGVSVPDACKFMADPSLDSVSVADKKAFLEAKGVDAFVIAQAECVAPEDNVQGHPELPAPKEWPMRGGSSGYHRMAGRVGAAYEGVVVRTALVKSWYDAGARL